MFLSDPENQTPGIVDLGDVPGIPSDFHNKCAEASASQSTQELNVLKMQASLHVYSSVLKNRMYDVVPMIVHLGILGQKGLIGNFNREMLCRFMANERLSSAMDQAPHVVAIREKHERSLQRLKDAVKMIQKIA